MPIPFLGSRTIWSSFAYLGASLLLVNFGNEGGENTPLAAQLLITSNDCAGGTASLDVEWDCLAHW